MSWYRRAGNLFRGDRLEGELDDEIEFHLAECMDELVAQGMTEDEARREARRRFGNRTSQKERTRDMNVVAWLEAAAGDVRYGLRQLRFSPGFTAVAVLSLALGIGANTAIFQLLDALRLRSLPVKDSEQLVMIDRAPDFYIAGNYRSRTPAFTSAQFDELRARQQAFSGVIAFHATRFNLARGGEARYAEGLYVSPNYLEVLGVKPVLGRGFEADDRSCAAAGAVLSFAFWEREFGGDPAAMGRTIHLGGRAFPILGVMPPEFRGMEPGLRFDVVLPLCAENLFAEDGKGLASRRDTWWLTLIGRMRPGWTVERAAAHLRDISPAVFRETVPEQYRADSVKSYLKNRFTAIPARAGISPLGDEYRNPLWLLLAMTGMVLLTACANLANLLLARASARQREIAVRQAMGASRPRLIGQLLAESLLLAAAGAALGAGLAQVLSRVLVGFLGTQGGKVDLPLGVDWRVFGFTAILALATCLLFGLAPAVRATRVAPAAAMHGGRATGTTRERQGLRRALIVGQVAFSLVLLVGAVLFSRSMANLLSAPTGMRTEGVLVAAVDASQRKLGPDVRRALLQELQNRIQSQPGVVSAAAVSLTPFSGNLWNGNVRDASAGRASAGGMSYFNRVSPGYFRTIAVPLLAGRDFDARDDHRAPEVAIINQAFAARVFPGLSPLGRTFSVEANAGEADRVYQVVGLVSDAKHRAVRDSLSSPMAFFPVAQNPDSPENRNFLIRYQGTAGGAMAGVRQTLAAVDPGLLVEFRVLSVQIRDSMLRERLMANLSAGFGVLAGLLSTLGLYGVMSYLVARRRNEIGLRIALGASGQKVMGLVLREAVLLLTAGLVLGLGASMALSRFAESLLFGIKPNDPLTVALAVALLACTALSAALLPARRAAHLDPVVALREE